MRNIWKNSSRLVLAAMTSLFATQFAAPAAAQTTTWNLYNTFPVATATNVVGVQKILDTIGQETKGALKINLHLAGSLPIKAETITQAVADNVVQMGDDAFFQGNVPIAGLLRLPLLIRNYDEFLKAEAIMEPYIKQAYDEKGVVVLGEYAYPLQYVFSIKKLASLNDLKGQRLRPTSPEQGEFLKRFGAISVSAGAAEVTAALERGTFDGVVTASAVGGKGWKEFLKYVYAMPLNFGNSIIIVNKAAFEAMPADIQATIRKVVQDNTKEINKTLLAENDTATKDLVAGGMTLTQPTAEENETALKTFMPYWDEWAKQRGPKAIEALQKVRAALGR